MKSKIFIFCLVFLSTMYFVLGTVNAQNAISLSISPPLVELMIKPDKEVKQLYTISNNGGDTVLSPKIVYFTPSDEFGNLDLTEDTAPDWIRYSKDPIVIKNGDKIDFNVLFSPPSNTEEIDHFLTLVFTTKVPTDILVDNSSFYETQIGTNILLTVSKDGNPKKSADIIEFSAPKIVDSFFGEIGYSLKLRNNGNSFWKPNGKIITKSETLKLAPQNIISGSKRNISCLDDENLVACSLKNKFKVGKITSTLEFSIDDDPKIYSEETVTYAIPFSLLLVFLCLYIIFKIWRKRR